MSESLRDRVDTGSSYMLGDLTVNVIPRSGVVWHEPVDTYAFEREPDDRLTAADVRRLYAEPGPLLPPSDVVSGSSFACCATCAATPAAQRCSGCPRGSSTSKLIERIRKCLG